MGRYTDNEKLQALAEELAQDIHSEDGVDPVSWTPKDLGKETTMPSTHPPYPAEYRRQIVELARLGRSAAELAREFEPTYETIRQWIKQAERDGWWP